MKVYNMLIMSLLNLSHNVIPELSPNAKRVQYPESTTSYTHQLETSFKAISLRLNSFYGVALVCNLNIPIGKADMYKL